MRQSGRQEWRAGWILGGCLAIVCGTRAHGIVLSEIHYHPRQGDEALEFVELAADSGTPEDISGYRFVEGIHFEIPSGTILGSGETLVICADLDAFRARYGAQPRAIGNFVGRLDAAGERVTLTDQVGLPVLSVRFRDEGAWSTVPDGTGHSLVLRALHLDASEPESWRPSDALGGSPGVLELDVLGGGPRFEDTEILARGVNARFRRGTAAFSSPSGAWIAPGFVDTSWELGPTGIGYGDDDDLTELADMRGGYTTVAARQRFTVDAGTLAGDEDFFLGMDYDDGFCAWINGVFVGSANCDVGFDFSSVATGSHEAGQEDLLPIPRDVLVAGENVLAVLGANFSISSSDFSLSPRVFRRRTVSPETENAPVVVNEVLRGFGGSPGWVELFNPNGAPVSLAGARLTRDPALPGRSFAAGVSIPSRGFLVVDGAAGILDLPEAGEIRLFLLRADGRALSAAAFDRLAPPGRAPGTWSELRYPDGGALDWVSGTPTRGAANTVARVESLVINEIFYQPPEDRAGEFLELFHRGTQPLDLSGFRFVKGIDYLFEAGTTMLPGEYLVLAQEPALIEEIYGLTGVLGPYVGQLSNAGENLKLEDTWGNPVDEVRYHDGGDWSSLANGRGSSLELIDARQDNALASAWAASDETAKSEWQELAYEVDSYVPAGETELHLFLVEQGSCLIDDISVAAPGGANTIPNPGFESSTAPWRIEGTHIASERVTHDSHGGNACLELRASGKGDTGVNRIEIDTSPRLSAGRYRISLWARWLTGSSLIISHGEFTAGPWGGRPGPSVNLSGNTLGGQFRLDVPRDLGTPGRENSATAALRAAIGEVNLGPVLGPIAHSPFSPQAGEPVRVQVLVRDADGVASVDLHYAVGSALGVVESISLRDDGRGGDSIAMDGIYTGSLPGFSSRARVVFWAEARDTRGQSRRYPVTAPESVSLLQAQGPASGSLEEYRIILDDRRQQELTSRRLHSNDLLEGSFVFDDHEAYQQVGVRYRGSPWGRPGRTQYRVRFQDDHLFHRGRSAINVSTRGSSPVEGTGYFLVGRTGTDAKPAPTADYLWGQGYVNGGSLGRVGIIQPVDGDYLERWYGDDAEGPVLKAVGRLAFSDAGERTGWDGASYTYMDGSPESYRAYFFHSVNQTRDDWTSFARLARVMDRRVSSNEQHDAEIREILDVEAWLRVVSLLVLTGGWDAFSIGNGHNGYLAHDSRTGLWGYFPFDMDNSFGDSNFPLFPTADADVARFLSRPRTRRVYLGVLEDLLGNYFSRAAADPWLNAVARDLGHSVSGVQSFISTRSSNVNSQIRTFTTAPFRVITGGGTLLVVADDRAVVEGDAPVSIAQMFVETRDGELTELDPEWSSPTRWSVSIDVPLARNELRFLGFDARGELIGSVAFVVENTNAGGAPRVSAWFPSEGSASGGFEVSFFGTNLPASGRVLFGGVESTTVVFDSSESLRAIAPRAPTPWPAASFFVDVVIEDDQGVSTRVPRAILYSVPPGFVRGDANGDYLLDVSDPIHTLFHLFLGRSIACADGADFDDSGSLELTDAVAGLELLFRGGAAPRAPYPDPGSDTTADALGCESLNP